MSDGSWQLQQTVFGLLDGALNMAVLANAPQDTPVPYVDIGESDALPDDVQCVAGLIETLTLHVWTAFGSQKQAKQEISLIRQTLHGRKLNVAGRAFALAAVTGSRLFPDGDNEFLHGVITLRVNHYGPEEG